MRLDATQVGTWLDWLWRSSWQAAILVALVLLVQLLLKNKVSARWRYNLWLIVLVRLLLPVLPESPLSIYNLLSAVPSATPRDLATHVAEDRIDARVISAPSADVFDDEVLAAASMASSEPPPAPASTIEDGAITSAPPVAPAPTPTPRAPIPWRPLLAALWFAGVLVLLARIGVATAKLARLSRRLTIVNDPSLLDLLAACKREMSVRQRITVLSSDDVPAPALMGFVRPRLLLPAPLLRDFDRRELRLILLHELAHVRRRDVAVNWIATLLHVLHWFNPVLWLALSRMRADRELATDELVLAATRAEDRQLYGQTILKLLQTLSRRTVLPGVVGILEGSHPMRRRITMIAQFKDKRPWSALAMAAIVGLSAVTLTDSVRGQATEEKKDTATVTEDTASNSDATPPTATSDEPGRSRRAAERNEPDVRTTTTIDSDTGGETSSSRAPSRRGTARTTDDDPASRVREWRKIETGRGGGRPDADPRQGYARAERANPPIDPAIQAQLDRKLPEVHFDAVAFVEVIDFLRDVTGANIFVNWRSLEAAGIDRSAPVTMRMRNVSFSTVLRLLLDSTAPGMLRHDIDGGVIIISANPELTVQMNPMTGMPAANPGVAASPSVTRVYEVRDLLGTTAGDNEAELKDPQLSQLRQRRDEIISQYSPEHLEVRKVDSQIRARQMELRRYGSGRSDEQARVQRLSGLVGIIQETIGQEQPLTVRGFNTKLIVRASNDVQREVAQLLSMLREDATAAGAADHDVPTTPRTSGSPPAK